MTQVEEEREPRFLKRGETLREQSDYIRKTNIKIISLQEGEERDKGAKNIFKEIIDDSFSNLGKELNIQIYKANRTPYYCNTKRLSPRDIILKLSKVKNFQRQTGEKCINL